MSFLGSLFSRGNLTPTTTTTPLAAMPRFSEFPKEIQWLVLEQAPELIDTLSFRLVCKAWNDFFPDVMRNLALGILGPEFVRLSDKERNLRVQESMLSRTAGREISAFEQSQHLLEMYCLNVLKSLSSGESSLQADAFEHFVELNNAIRQNYEIIGRDSCSSSICLYSSFEVRGEEEKDALSRALCSAWQGGLQDAIAKQNTPPNNPEGIVIPGEDASCQEILSFFETKGVEALLSHVTRIEIIDGELEYIPPQINYFTRLQCLDLRENKIRGLPYLDLPHLEELVLVGNQITHLPRDMGNLPKLRDLWLGRNQLTQLPEQMPPNLETLGLGYNNLTIQSFPRGLYLAHLGTLVLMGNSPLLTGAVLQGSVVGFLPLNFPQLSWVTWSQTHEVQMANPIITATEEWGRREISSFKQWFVNTL